MLIISWLINFSKCFIIKHIFTCLKELNLFTESVQCRQHFLNLLIIIKFFIFYNAFLLKRWFHFLNKKLGNKLLVEIHNAVLDQYEKWKVTMDFTVYVIRLTGTTKTESNHLKEENKLKVSVKTQRIFKVHNRKMCY